MEAPEQTESELLQNRREKLNALQAQGVNAFGGRYDITHQPGALRKDFAVELEVKVAGRMTARRIMGKAAFFDLSDFTGRIQVYVNKKEIGDEAFAQLTELLDIGDWVGVEGKTFFTKTEEPSVHASSLTVLGKSLRPLPDKWHGVTDREIKYRQRYLDLISNEKSRELFVTRSLMVAEIRRFLQERGFLEVETPMMQDVPGGAAARPFETDFHALNQKMYLRIAPELFLKRLLVGGFTKVFELNRNFRNEGLSRRHNPEFTMLEAYWAFSDFEQMADMVETLVCHLAEKFCGGLIIEHKDDEGEVTRTIDLTRPWKRAPFKDLVRGVAGDDWFDKTTEQKKLHAREIGVEVSEHMADHEVSQQVFEKLIEEKSFNPVFVTHVPKELVPLAKENAVDGTVVDVYELIINGQEISPGYSELNDPIVQRERLEHQAGEETQKLDEEFLLALDYGMPPAGGIGIGIDRLVMMLTGAESIRDVILFPQLKKK
ncbi:lysine--tRNA ligase [Phragmitibacter flavus]|uniref:Lysine--tRNA ligase n=1 Tax=Phragmitibacter flavus TaxID=2576071 RepID=A0A5R8KH18_9BACT|nr:lysine--tRNA ligase [Phragmitibacter flavus]TLD71582.1 lysine--tRNA ligase [Phragmitibacter flavus]